MRTFELNVVAVNRIFYKGLCKQLIIPAMDGLMTIMAYHERAVVALKPGEMRIQTDTDEWITAVAGVGHVQVDGNKVVVIVDFAERPEEVDARMAQLALEEAQEEMRQNQSFVEFNIAQAKMERALARLVFKQKYGNRR